MEVTIIPISKNFEKEINRAKDLLNYSQVEFNFDILTDVAKLSIIRKEYDFYLQNRKNNVESIEIFRLIKNHKLNFNSLVVIIIDEYLKGEFYENLYGDMMLVNSQPRDYGVITTYEVKYWIKGLPFEIYFIYFLLRYSINNISQIHLSHKDLELKH